MVSRGLVLALAFIRVHSFDPIRNGLLKNGTCLLIGNFLPKRGLMDLEDQVMILNSLDHKQVLNKDVVINIQVTVDDNLKMMTQYSSFQAFIEDSIKGPSCAVLLQANTSEMSIDLLKPFHEKALWLPNHDELKLNHDRKISYPIVSASDARTLIVQCQGKFSLDANLWNVPRCMQDTMPKSLNVFIVG